MTAYLFEIDIGEDTFCFSLTVETLQQAERMIERMSEAVFIGELEMPDTLLMGNDTLH